MQQLPDSDGQYPLTYDAIGNLKSYGGWTFEWEAGRQLKRQTQNATVVTYDYDHNGMRVRKTVANTSGYVYTTYNYTWHGNQLAHMTKGSDVLHFFYDAQNRPAKVSYNGTIYTYIHNLQGDVVGLLDANGTVVVEYKYNAWGTQLSRTGELANTLGYANPFRYRGYIYDDETWMYWLRSRYYYPELHRFISADSVMDGAGLFGANLYAYCKNAPVNCEDQTGHASTISYSEDAYERNYRYAGSGGSDFIGSAIGIALGFGIPLLITGSRHITRTRSESTIGSDEDVDGKYYVAIAFGNASPILLPKAMDFNEALNVACTELTAATVLDIFYESYPFAQIVSKVAAFGIYTRREKDAQKLAIKLGPCEYDWHGIGLQHYNIRNRSGLHNEIHIWFSF